MALLTIMEHEASPSFSIEEFLAGEREKDLFRFSTAGSVDDGKSTLIGRLLYDTQSVYDDQLRSIEGKGTTAAGQIDFALLTDGLRAEREQGITIDVAYRYFATQRRKFIIADTPGHEQYTRNMATGASTADAAVVLIDARKGVLPQSLRHAYIASLLGVRHILVAVNKMDLVGYEQQTFRAIEEEFSSLLANISQDTGRAAEAIFVPVSALAGDNIVHRSQLMKWYEGPALLELLESLPSANDTRREAFRFPVQRVMRPNHSFRGFAGQIASGTVRVGDRVTVAASGRAANVTRIVTYDGDLQSAHAPLSVTLTLSEELDISRGDLVVSAESQATLAHGCVATLVWMDEQKLELNRRYLLKQTSQVVPASIAEVRFKTDVRTLAREAAVNLEMNEIGAATVRFSRPMAIEPYTRNRSTGAFILIDPQTNKTVAAGMVSEALGQDALRADIGLVDAGPVTADERAARWGHRGGVLALRGPAALIDQVERSLFVAGTVTIRAQGAEQAALLGQNGILALSAEPSDEEFLLARVNDQVIEIAADDPVAVSASVERLLRSTGILVAPEKGNIQ